MILALSIAAAIFVSIIHLLSSTSVGIDNWRGRISRKSAQGWRMATMNVASLINDGIVVLLSDPTV